MSSTAWRNARTLSVALIPAVVGISGGTFAALSCGSIADGDLIVMVSAKVQRQVYSVLPRFRAGPPGGMQEMCLMNGQDGRHAPGTGRVE